jgi:hypothetical protein
MKILIVCGPIEKQLTPGMEVRCVDCQNPLWLSYHSLKRVTKQFPKITVDNIETKCLKCSNIDINDVPKEEIEDILKALKNGEI